MLLKAIHEVESFVAGDLTLIREVLHSKNDSVVLPYSLAHASLEVGKRSVRHRLEDRIEVFIFLEGEGTAFVGSETTPVKVGDILLVPAGEEQYLQNTGTTTMRFLCIVSPPWTKESEEITE